MTDWTAIDAGELRQRIYRYLARHPGRTLDQIERALPASRLAIAQALEAMCIDGEAVLDSISTGRGYINQWWAA